MKALLLACAACVGLGGGLAPAWAADPAGEKLTDALLADVDNGIVPRGYTFLTVEPFALGEGPEAKATGAVHALFERKNRAAGQPEFDGGYEGFAYFVFPSAADAQRLAGSETIKEGFPAWAGDAYKPDSTQTVGSLTVKSTEGASIDWRCRAIDYLISCVHADGTVLTQVVLQDPKLRQATSDGERQAAITGRAQGEADGMIKTALLHLATARKTAR